MLLCAFTMLTLRAYLRRRHVLECLPLPVVGHGSQARDQMGDEADGLNETLCPCDFKQVCADSQSNIFITNDCTIIPPIEPPPIRPLYDHP